MGVTKNMFMPKLKKMAGNFYIQDEQFYIFAQKLIWQREKNEIIPLWNSPTHIYIPVYIIYIYIMIINI